MRMETGCRRWGVVLALLLLPAVLCWAQAGMASAEEAAGTGMSLSQVIETGGWLMYVLGVMSVIGLAMVLYFLVVLRREQVIPREFTKDIFHMIRAARFEEARHVCDKNASAVSAIASVALDHMHRTGHMDPGMLREMMEGEGSRQATLLQNQTQYLLDLAVVSPMVGLLGTVMGMLQAFNAVALDIAKAKPMVLAAGVSQALVTTAAGLIVGIPAMVFYAYFRGRSSKLVSQLEGVSADLLNTLVEAARKQEQAAGADEAKPDA